MPRPKKIRDKNKLLTLAQQKKAKEVRQRRGLLVKLEVYEDNLLNGVENPTPFPYHDIQNQGAPNA